MSFNISPAGVPSRLLHIKSISRKTLWGEARKKDSWSGWCRCCLHELKMRLMHARRRRGVKVRSLNNSRSTTLSGMIESSISVAINCFMSSIKNLSAPISNSITLSAVSSGKQFEYKYCIKCTKVSWSKWLILVSLLDLASNLLGEFHPTGSYCDLAQRRQS